MSGAQATATAKQKGFDVSSTTQAAPDPKGWVIAQSPAAGGSTSDHNVKLIVSSGPADVAVPTIESQGGGGVRCMMAEVPESPA